MEFKSWKSFLIFLSALCLQIDAYIVVSPDGQTIQFLKPILFGTSPCTPTSAGAIGWDQNNQQLSVCDGVALRPIPTATAPISCLPGDFLFFNGTNLVCKSFASIRGCPPDMAKVGSFCIDLSKGPSNASTTWSWHNLNCISQGKRLCSVGEWEAACTLAPPGVTNMLLLGTEYVDSYGFLYIPSYYSYYISMGGAGGACARKYYSGWGCVNGACYDTVHPGNPNYSGRCCKQVDFLV